MAAGLRLPGLPLGNELIGHSAPLAGDWTLDPVALAAALVAGLFFAAGFRRLRARGRADLTGADRAALFGLALAAGTLALVSPLDAAADRLLSAHMLQHVLLGDLTPALLVVALRGPLLFFAVPRMVLTALARATWPRRAVGVLLRPPVAFGLWAVSLAVWHVPRVYDAALESGSLHVVEHASFFLGGLLVWSQLVDPARRRALDDTQRLFYALALFACGQVLVNTLILSYRPLYPAYFGQSNPLFGLSPLADQQAAALVMMAEQILTFGTFAFFALRLHLRPPAVLVEREHPLAF